jgi:hypothetical protein
MLRITAPGTLDASPYRHTSYRRIFVGFRHLCVGSLCGVKRSHHNQADTMTWPSIYFTQPGPAPLIVAIAMDLLISCRTLPTADGVRVGIHLYSPSLCANASGLRMTTMLGFSERTTLLLMLIDTNVMIEYVFSFSMPRLLCCGLDWQRETECRLVSRTLFARVPQSEV